LCDPGDGQGGRREELRRRLGTGLPDVAGRGLADMGPEEPAEVAGADAGVPGERGRGQVTGELPVDVLDRSLDDGVGGRRSRDVQTDLGLIAGSFEVRDQRPGNLARSRLAEVLGGAARPVSTARRTRGRRGASSTTKRAIGTSPSICRKRSDANRSGAM
jgi:hypothetical protein